MGLSSAWGGDRDGKSMSATDPRHAYGSPHVMQSGSHVEIDSFIRSTIQKHGMGDAFYVLDLGLLVRLFQGWVQAMPRVRPFYAVKCSPDRALLTTLAALGAGFDCASKAEISQVLDLGVATDRIIFANPCKMQSHVAYAASVGVNLTTFDSESEVHKVKAHHPGAVLLLRIRTDDRGARCPLGVKYGALMYEVEHLLRVADNLHVPVAGVSFHIGSGATAAFSFTDAIAAAREVFDISERLGLPKMHILDIGGGFTSGCSGSLKFSDAAEAVNDALDSYFPLEMGVKIIAEPGRYFAETPSTLATTVIDESKNNNCHGDCGSLPTHNSTVFGPTCDGLDTVLQGASLPDLSIGDWIVFPDMGAYTAAAGSSFNGFSMSDIPTFYVFSINLQGCSILGYLKRIAPQLMKGCVPDLNADGNIIENWAVNCSSTSGRQISVSSGGCS
ncbi:hypothetical protein CY35_02G011200 [Sphagnum magellanicum]|nr:hypothetical protein CY35_02G011200 [Sphagnum magellanicum]